MSDLGSDAFVVYKRQAIENGMPIFPKKFSIEGLKNIKLQVGSFEYACNFDNDPISSETQAFKPPIRYWKELGECVTVVTFDPATSEDKDSCDAVVFCGGVDRANVMKAVAYKAYKVKNPDDMIGKIFEFVSLFKPREVVIETNGGQEVYIKLVEEEQRRRGVFFKVVGLHQHRDKRSRIMALQPRWESGNLLLKEGMVELEEQMMRFPVSQRLDILDAFAMVMQVEKPVHTVKRKAFLPFKFRKLGYGRFEYAHRFAG